MGLMQRLAAIFSGKANKMLDRAEDPRETLDLSYQRQLELLQRVRRGLADVATSRKRVELQAEQLHQSGTNLEDQARAAVGQNREDLAREALTRLEAVKAQLRDLATQRDQLQAEEAKLTNASSRLEGKVQAFRVRKETIKATYTAAEAQAQIGEAMSGMSEEMGDVGLAVQRAEDKTAQLQARAGAIDELMASGALDDVSQPTDSIQAELDKVGVKPSVEAELTRLKAEVGGPALDAQSKSAS